MSDDVKRTDDGFMDICSVRRAKGWSQAELAKRAGMPQSQISRIERNSNTTVRSLKRIASALGVSVSSLIQP